LTLAALLAATALGGVTPTQATEGPPKGKAWVLTGATIHTMTSAPYLDGTLVIEAGRVTCISGRQAGAPTSPACTTPKGAWILRLNGGVILPGLVESAAHIGMVEVSLEPASQDGVVAGVDIAAHVRAMDGLHMNSRLLEAARKGGVTALISRPLGRGLVIGQSVALRSLGATVEAAVLSPTVAMHVNLGNRAKMKGRPLVGARSGQLAALRDALRRAGRIAQTAKKPPAGDAELSRIWHDPAMQALARVRRGELPLAIHANRAEDISAALRLGRESKVRPIIIGGAEAHVVAGELARDKVPVVLAPVRARPNSFETLRARDDNATLLQRAGVTLVLATASSHRARNLRWQAGLAVAEGLPRAVALRAITRTPAEVFGLGATAGRIAAGQPASLVAFDGDPLTLKSRIKAVIIGEHVDLQPLQR